MIQDSDEPDQETGELSWTEEKDEGGDSGEDEKVYIGKVSDSADSNSLSVLMLLIRQVPIMLRSHFCILDGLAEPEMLELNECPYDKVRRLFTPLPLRSDALASHREATSSSTVRRRFSSRRRGWPPIESTSSPRRSRVRSLSSRRSGQQLRREARRSPACRLR